MPRLTLILSNEEANILKGLASRGRTRTPESVALRAVRRVIQAEMARIREREEQEAARREGRDVSEVPTVRSVYAQKEAARQARRLALTSYVLEHGVPEGQMEKRALAARFGITERTLYRELDVILPSLQLLPPTPEKITEADTGPVVIGRPRRTAAG